MGRNIVVNTINRCKCCLKEDGLKDMWKEHYSQGALEIYGDMIRDCFVMPWYPPLINSEYICESCIIRLRAAISFKTGMLLSDQTLKEYFGRESETKLKLEDDSEDDMETEYLRVQRTEYLEVEESVESIKREIKIEVDESDSQVSTYKTKDKYTQDDLNKCLDAVTSKTLTQVEASIIYDIPRRIISETLSRSYTDSKYESGAPGPSTKKNLRTEIVHKQSVTTQSRQDFKPSETRSTDNESRRGSPLQIIIKHDNNQKEVDDENPTIDHVQKHSSIIGVRLSKAPKTSAERSREFRARKALLKQQSKQVQEPNAKVESAAEDIRSAGPSKDNQVPGSSGITTIEKRAKSVETTRRWRDKLKCNSESSKKQAKTAAQRMREYRKRKKLAKKILLKRQSNEDLYAIVSTSSAQVNQRPGPSTIIGDIVIERDSNQKEVDDENPTIDRVQKPRPSTGVRLNKVPKISAERGREFRARKALLKQQSKQVQEPNAKVESAAEDIRSAGPSEDNQVPGPSGIITIEKRAKSVETTRRWREKIKCNSESSKKQAKTAAQRMREYRKRKKLAKKILLKRQSNEDLYAIVSTSSVQVNQRPGPSTIIGDIVIERDSNQKEVDEKFTIDRIQKLRPSVGVRFNKMPKISAERGREFRARKALLKQQSKQVQEPGAIVESAAEDIL